MGDYEYNKLKPTFLCFKFLSKISGVFNHPTPFVVTALIQPQMKDIVCSRVTVAIQQTIENAICTRHLLHACDM